MVNFVPQIRLFLSSPGDVGDERGIAQNIIQRMPNRHTFRDRLKLVSIAWDDLASSTPMEASLTPQEAINQGLPMPSQCDVTIVLFWSRLGTPFTHTDGITYESGTHWELMDALNSPSRTYIYRRTEKPKLGDPDHPDYDRNLSQYRRLQTFLKGELFYDGDEILRTIKDYSSPSEFAEKFELDLEGILLRILKDIEGTMPIQPEPPTLPQTPNIRVAETEKWNPEQSPFPGLPAFTEADAPIFFGRGRETDDLVQLVKDHRFVAVVGASGSGKSSLVGAGLMPRLRDNAIAHESTGSKAWRIVIMKPDVAPIENLYQALLVTFPKLKPNPLEARRIKQNFIADIREAPETFLDICEAGLEGEPAWAETLLFIDQFEELLTLASDEDKQAFARLLVTISTSERVRAVVTMRHDFYPKAIETPELARLLNTSLNLPAPKRDALRQMIERPAERAELTLDEGLVQRILDDTGDEPGNLALMAYALDELYKLDDDRHLTHSEYEALGGVKGAIGTRAENQWQALALDESILQGIFHELVEVDERGVATRRRATVNVDDLAPEAEAFITAFVASRLLVTDYDEATKKATIEVAHEAILRQWKRLADWIDITQDDHRTISRMKREARIWREKGEPNHLRPNAETLQEFHDACDRLGIEVDKLALGNFIEAEQERLYREIEDITTTHQRRYDIGERLARIGDYREGIGVKDGLPDMLWLPVQGSQGKYKFEFGEFEVPNFFIAKYLTTKAQVDAFLDSDWDNPIWWRDFPKDYQPQNFRNVTNGNINAPRDTISWYQSVAFGRWLTAQFTGVKIPKPVVGTGFCLSEYTDKSQNVDDYWIIGQDAQIRLPTEWEWQWAAMNGAENSTYPWGEWQEGYANTTEAGINDRSTAVGMYPHGRAQCGALDMSGNLWEWCLNKSSPAEELQIDNSGDSRVRRGGSFVGYRNLAAAAYRHNLNPYDGLSRNGFRLVLVFLSP